MTEAKTKSDQTSLSLDLQINNSDLSSLVGPLDSNLAQLENFLNVEISRRGASFGIKGTQANCRKAIQALTDLAAIAERKSDELTAEDIQLYLVGQNAPAEELAAEEPVPELRTNRKGLQGRTPMQRTYIRNILSHDVSFGIGPAGTGKTEGAKAIAAGLNLPYLKYTCSANTEVYDFIGQVFPETDGPSTGDPDLDRERQELKAMGGINYENVKKLMGLPDLDDMDYDPDGVYL